MSEYLNGLIDLIKPVTPYLHISEVIFLLCFLILAERTTLAEYVNKNIFYWSICRIVVPFQLVAKCFYFCFDSPSTALPLLAGGIIALTIKTLFKNIRQGFPLTLTAEEKKMARLFKISDETYLKYKKQDKAKHLKQVTAFIPQNRLKMLLTKINPFHGKKK